MDRCVFICRDLLCVLSQVRRLFFCVQIPFDFWPLILPCMSLLATFVDVCVLHDDTSHCICVAASLSESP